MSDSRMFARWAVIGENVNATVATFQRVWLPAAFAAASLKEPHYYHVIF